MCGAHLQDRHMERHLSVPTRVATSRSGLDNGGREQSDITTTFCKIFRGRHYPNSHPPIGYSGSPTPGLCGRHFTVGAPSICRTRHRHPLSVCVAPLCNDFDTCIVSGPPLLLQSSLSIFLFYRLTLCSLYTRCIGCSIV